jgi:magnesium transporter
MSKHRRRHKTKSNNQAGGNERGPLTIECIGAPEQVPTTIQVTVYDASNFHEERLQRIEEIPEFLHKGQTVWVRVEGLQEPEKIRQIAEIFGLHSLAIEDVLVTHQRGKLAQFGRTFFLITHILLNEETIKVKQLSIFFSDNYVVTFQDAPIKNVDLLRDRIKADEGIIRAQKADYLVYLILDNVIDTYFPVLEQFGEMLDDLEEAAIEDPSRRTMAAIHSVKRQLLVMRRVIWPLREAINALLRDGAAALSEETRIHFRYCYDEVVRVIDLNETYRELGADLMDVYLSSVSNRLNEIMKVLTIITVVFAPPTLIAGIYGMNFNHQVSPFNMPEYTWYFGYPYALILMLCTSLMIYSTLKWRGFLDLSNRSNRKIGEIGDIGNKD